MTVYMEITLDEYELPVAIADSVVELAKICKTSANTIKSTMSHVKNHTSSVKRSKYIKVQIDD